MMCTRGVAWRCTHLGFPRLGLSWAGYSVLIPLDRHTLGLLPHGSGA
jgi:hypothetical protein